MKKERKGFTLVELIAVLVILAIVIAISAPLVLNLISKVRTSADKRSVDGYGKALEIGYMAYIIEEGVNPPSLADVKAEYTGSKVECNVMELNKNGSVYLSECTVNNREVKDASTDDGWYHYGKLILDNEAYVDMYGVSLTKAIEEYNNANNSLPEDYKALKLDYNGEEISCDVTINYDGSVYLTKCSVGGAEVKDDATDDGYYHYGTKVASYNIGDQITYNGIDFYVI